MLDRRPVAARDLVEGRVQAPVVADPGGERVEVGLGELGELAEALDLGDDLVLAADRLEHAGVGAEARLAAALAAEPELLEQDLAELLGRADHELLARQLPDLALELGGVGADAGGGLLELDGVELDALLLALAQHVDERQLDLLEQVHEPALVDLLGLALGERVDEHGERGLVVLGVDRQPALLGELVERVAAAGGVEQVGRDLGVEDEVRRHVAERLGVVGDDGPLLGGGDELGRVVDLARERVRAARRRRRSASAPRAGSARPRRSPARARRARAGRRRACRRPRRGRGAPGSSWRPAARGAGSPRCRPRPAPPRAGAAGRAAPTRGRSRAGRRGRGGA